MQNTRKFGWGAIAGLMMLWGHPNLAQTRLIGPTVSPPRPDAPRLQPPTAADTNPLTLPETVQKQAATLVNQYAEGTATPCTLTIERVLFDNRRVVTTSPWSCRLLGEPDRQSVLTVLFPNLAQENRPSPTRLQPVWVTVAVGAKAGRQTALVRTPGTPVRQRFLLPFVLEGAFGQAAN